MRILTCVGDATSPATWSGTPYFFLQASKAAGFLDLGWALRPERMRVHRLGWNLLELLRSGSSGGFQYSLYFLRGLVGQVSDQQGPVEVISHFPLLPPMESIRGELSFYIDATLAQVFEDYGVAAHVSRRIIADALVRERDQYQAASRIVCMSRWAATAVVERYGIQSSKVHVIPGGANVDETGLSTGPAWDGTLAPLRLGFVGKDWRRKGLEVVLMLAEQVACRGFAVEVVAAGFLPADGPRHPLLRAIGFLDKARDSDGFARLVRSFHFGCLFSSVEAFGLSNVECQRLGVPVLTWDRGGIANTVHPGTAHLFPGGTSAEEMADVVVGYLHEPENYRRLRHDVEQCADAFSWGVTVKRFKELWDQSEQGGSLRHVG